MARLHHQAWVAPRRPRLSEARHRLPPEVPLRRLQGARRRLRRVVLAVRLQGEQRPRTVGRGRLRFAPQLPGKLPQTRNSGSSPIGSTPL